MIRESDVKWWVLEARRHPESAPEIIEQLAARLVELDAQTEQLRAQLLHAQTQPRADSASELAEARRQLAELRQLLTEHLALEPGIVFITRSGQAARLSLARAARLVRSGASCLERRAVTQMWGLRAGRPQERLVLLAANGVGSEWAVQALPTLEEGSLWPAGDSETAAADRPFGPLNPLSAATIVAETPRLWTVVTQRGWARQFLGAALARDLAERRPLTISPLGRDVPVALVSGDAEDIAVFTRWGRAARFPQRALAAQGNAALELDADDEVIAALPLAAEGEIVLVTAAGAAVRRSTTDLKPRARPGGPGRPLIQAFDLLAVLPAAAHAHLVLLTHTGRLCTYAVDAIPFHERVGRGTPLGDFTRDPAIAAVIVPHLTGL